MCQYRLLNKKISHSSFSAESDEKVTSKSRKGERRNDFDLQPRVCCREQIPENATVSILLRDQCRYFNGLMGPKGLDNKAYFSIMNPL